MKIYDAQINHMTNPMGFTFDRLVFSWKVTEAEGKCQKSAQIRIAKDKVMKDIVKDTGMDDLDSLGTKVEMAVEPYTRYYWNVTVVSDAGETAVSETSYFETAKMNDPWIGKWITCDNTQKRHPVFEKQIDVNKEVTSARLYICGLGLYEAAFNGKRIGEEYLTPYSNDYNSWVQYQTFDITEDLKKSGKLSVMLGNGWYKARFGFAAHGDSGYYGDEWKLIAELHIRYIDGTETIIGTDESWGVSRSKIIFSNLYDGEWMDETLPELPMEKAVFCDASKGTLMERLSIPVTIHEAFKPKELIHTPAGELVFDMGQEFAGTFDLTFDVPAGTAVHVQTGEILQNGNFYNDNLRSAKSEYFYTSNGGKKTIRPHFTYFGYRYVKVTGVPDLTIDDFTGYAFYSNITKAGEMTTGDELVNQFISNVRWGLKSNFIDVPTDCPQRDERMGWTGDAQVFSSTAMYLEDTYSFYKKYLFDMYQEQKADGGKVHDVIPSAGVHSTACVWGDAATIIPWNMYQTYGDRSILEDQFDSMKSWVDYMKEVDGDDHGWRYVFHYGDWLALDKPTDNIEDCMGGTDEEFIANLYYAVSAGIVADAAKVLGKNEEEKTYRALSEKQFAVVKDEYFSKTGRCCIKTQTALTLALKYHLTDNVELTRKQLRKLFEDNHDKLKTGFVGTPLLCNVLTDNGFTDLAFKLLLNKEFPGWLHEVLLGATTVWERWNSILDDGTISGINMNSMNHYSYGAVLDWMFRHVAGIACEEGTVGYREVRFAPEYNWNLRECHGSYDSPMGVYKSGWKLLDPTTVTVHFTVPFGGCARVKLPYSDEEEKVLYAGDYEYTYTLSKSMKKVFTIDSTINELMNDEEMRGKLSAVIPVDQVPNQYYGNSFREIKEEIYSEFIPDEVYQKILQVFEEA